MKESRAVAAIGVRKLFELLLPLLLLLLPFAPLLLSVLEKLRCCEVTILMAPMAPMAPNKGRSRTLPADQRRGRVGTSLGGVARLFDFCCMDLDLLPPLLLLSLPRLKLVPGVSERLRVRR